MKSFLKPVSCDAQNKRTIASSSPTSTQNRNPNGLSTFADSLQKSKSPPHNRCIEAISCSRCTLLNPRNATTCAACDTPLSDAQPRSSSATDPGKDRNVRNINVIVNPDDSCVRRSLSLHGNDETINASASMGSNAPKKKLNLFETLSNIQKTHDQRAAEIKVDNKPSHSRSGIGQSLSAIAATRQIESSSRNFGSSDSNAASHSFQAADHKHSSFNKSIEQRSFTIPLSAKRLKEQNGTYTSISTNENQILSETAMKTHPHLIRPVSSAVISNNSTSQSKPPRNMGEVIELDLDDDIIDDNHDEQNRIFTPSHGRNHHIKEKKTCSRLDTILDEIEEPSVSLNINRRPTKSMQLHRNESDDEHDDDDSSPGSLADFIVDEEEDEEEEESYADGDDSRNSGTGSNTQTSDFLDSDDEYELNTMYTEHSRTKAGDSEAIVLTDEESLVFERHGRNISIDNRAHRNNDIHTKHNKVHHSEEPVFDLTAGYVHHTRNDPNIRSEFRELIPTFPRIAPHYWSVKQLSKEGCCAIDFNLFTLDAGATNPNTIGHGKTNKATSKAPLSVEESYAKRKAARLAKTERKRRATAAKAARRKSSRRGKRSRRSDDVADGGDGGDDHNYAAVDANVGTGEKKKRTYFKKAAVFRKRK